MVRSVNKDIRKVIISLLLFQMLIIAAVSVISAQEVYEPAVVKEFKEPQFTIKGLGWDGQYIVILDYKYNATADRYDYFILKMNTKTWEIVENKSIDIYSYGWVNGFYVSDGKYYTLSTNWTSTGAKIYILVINSNYEIETVHNITSILAGKVEELFGFAYDGTYFWASQMTFEKNKTYLLGIDVAEEKIAKNITIQAPPTLKWPEYYLTAISYYNDKLLVVDSENRLLRILANDTAKEVTNITACVEQYFVGKNITDYYLEGFTVTPEYIWASFYYHNNTDEYIVFFGFATTEIFPTEGPSPGTATQAYTSAVSGIIAASASAVATTTVSAAAASAATAAPAAAGVPTIQKESLLDQLKSLFKLRKLKDLFRKKKKKEEEEEVLRKPSFPLAAGIITLFGLIAGVILVTGVLGRFESTTVLSGISASIGFPMSIFGLISSIVILSLYMRKKLQLTTMTKIMTIISLIASIYGLYASPLALTAILTLSISIGYMIVAAMFTLFLAGTQILDFISLVESISQ